MAKKTQTTIENTIKCRDCQNSYDPDYDNLSIAYGHPMLTHCKFNKYMVFYNVVEKKCTNAKPIVKK